MDQIAQCRDHDGDDGHGGHGGHGDGNDDDGDDGMVVMMMVMIVMMMKGNEDWENEEEMIIQEVGLIGSSLRQRSQVDVEIQMQPDLNKQNY